MNNEYAMLIIRGILKSHHITDDMILKYFTKSFNSDEEGIPEDYFYSFIETKLSNAIEITLSLLEQQSNLNIVEVSNLVENEFVKG